MDPGSRSPLDASTIHALSNHLAVILGFVELVLSETAVDDPRRSDLVEIRDAALEAARIIGRPMPNRTPGPADADG